MAITHMGQPPSNHVTLESIGVNSTGDTLPDQILEESIQMKLLCQVHPIRLLS